MEMSLNNINIIKNITDKKLTIIGGAPKCGKSVLCNMIAASAVKGEDIFSKEHFDKKRVLYCVTESDADYVQNILRDKYQFSKADFENIVIISREYFTSSKSKNMSIVANAIMKNDIKFVILDMGTLFIKGNMQYENLYNEMNKFYEIIKKLSCGILFTRHTKKSKSVNSWVDNIMGSQAFVGAVDTILSVERDFGSDNGVLYGLFRGKQDDLKADMKLDREEGKWIACSSTVVKGHLELGILEYLRDHKNGACLKDIAKGYKNYNSVGNALKRLSGEKGLLYKNARNTWCLTEKGEKLVQQLI